MESLAHRTSHLQHTAVTGVPRFGTGTVALFLIMRTTPQAEPTKCLKAPPLSSSTLNGPVKRPIRASQGSPTAQAPRREEGPFVFGEGCVFVEIFLDKNGFFLRSCVRSLVSFCHVLTKHVKMVLKCLEDWWVLMLRVERKS